MSRHKKNYVQKSKGENMASILKWLQGGNVAPLRKVESEELKAGQMASSLVDLGLWIDIESNGKPLAGIQQRVLWYDLD